MRINALSSKDSSFIPKTIDFITFQIQFSKALLLRSSLYLRILSRKPWVMRRTACLGNDVFELLEFLPKRSINIQKGRIDLLTKSLNQRFGILKLYQAKTFIERSDIRPLIFRQSISRLNLLRPPIVVLIDSYSELTDQEFILPNKAKIYCNFSDVFQTVDKTIESNGLLDLRELDSYYEKLTVSIAEKWGGGANNFPAFS